MIREILDLLDRCYCRKVKTKQPATYTQIYMLIKQIYKDAHAKWWNNKCAEIVELERLHRSKEMHEKVKEMAKARNDQRRECIRDQDGRMFFLSRCTDEDVGRVRMRDTIMTTKA